jgi:hemerythrin-like domain-containing protein
MSEHQGTHSAESERARPARSGTGRDDRSGRAPESRRTFLHRAASGAGLALLGWTPQSADARGGRVPRGDRRDQDADDVSANEDLIREHGVLKRALLVYQEASQRLRTNTDLPPSVLSDTAKLIQRFIEEYHEKQEEDYIFPRFEKAGQQVELVRTLRLQHQRGRERTAAIIQLAKPASLQDRAQRAQVVEHIAAFTRMYEPHEAREDTVLFPALHKLISKSEYDALGEELERNERRIFGGDGFDMAVETVARLEKTLGIYDLAQFTPPPTVGSR